MRDIINKIKQIEETANEPVLIEEIVAKIADPLYESVGNINVTAELTDEEIAKQVDAMFETYWDNDRGSQKQ